MILTVLNIKWFNLFFLIVISLGLSSCFNLLGTDKLAYSNPISFFASSSKTPRDRQIAEINRSDIKISIRWVGNAPPLTTSRNALGRINRYVIPYTRETMLFQLTLENHSPSTLTLAPANIQLKTLPAQQKYSLLNLDYFKTQWPLEAVRTEEMVIDRSMAMGEVLRTLFTGQTLLPGRKRTSILAFPKWEEGVTQCQLIFSEVQLGAYAFDAYFLFEADTPNLLHAGKRFDIPQFPESFFFKKFEQNPDRASDDHPFVF